MEIVSGSTALRFEIQINENMNVCDLLSKAKTDGKISSIIFDDSYLETFKSRFVKEIHGISGNWVFKVNGVSPLVFSLINLKNNYNI